MTYIEERDYVRELAIKVAELASTPENESVKKRWRDVNALRKPDRAPVWCCPVGCWNELLPDDSLQCSDPFLRGIERELRQILIKHDIGDDTPIQDFWPVPALFDVDPPNVWGVEIKRHTPEVAGGAWAYDPPLKSEEDFDRLTIPTYTYNQARTEEALARAHDAIGDILPVRLTCGPNVNPTLETQAAELRGLEQLLLDMAEKPDLVHRLMSHVRDATLAVMDQMEATGLLTFNGIGPMYESDPIGTAPENGRLTYANLWGHANNQEFDRISPRMWEEFALSYQLPVLTRFGLVSYGCCDDLTDKIDGVLTIPNLRIFVCSAWTNLDRVIEKCGTNYTIMWRQKASDVVFARDCELDRIRHHLEEGMRKLQGCCYQVVLRELQTLAGHADRLHQWTRIAVEIAEKYA
ncbi:MAG: hypothetical protein QHI38_05425 [Armatimonadota bacterium]|nr:hypothetical protein [Armatimonadota bacterium]